MPPSLSTRRKVLQAVGGSFSLLFAGCSAIGSPEPSASATPTESPRVQTRLTETDSSTPTAQLTSYESLSEKGQELFREIVQTEGPVERASDEIPWKLWNAEYVEFQDDVYRLSKRQTTSGVAEHTLEVGITVQSEVDESELAAYSDLSEAARNAFTQAHDEGSYTVREEPLPDDLREVQFVKYDGSYYELQFIVADFPIWELSVSKQE